MAHLVAARGFPFHCGHMKQEIFEKIYARMTGYSLATFGASHGYRLEGDTVALHAMFTVWDAAAHNRNWALQLWACPQAPFNAADITGHLVAQVGLPPIGEIADDIEHFEVRADASLLAGQADYSMVLVLVAGSYGCYDEIHDFYVYPRRQEFYLPQLRGSVGYRIENDRVHINVGSIFNPRSADNLSGTLAIELWALSEPYAGGAFAGVKLAGANLGQIFGQTESAIREFDLSFSEPPVGVWNYVLMLWEWTEAGFITRDFVNFNQLVSVMPAFQPVVEFTVAEPIAPVVVPVELVTEAVAPAVEAAPAVAEVVETPVVAQPVATVATKKPAKKSKQDGKVSVNSASAEDLTAVKGMPAKVAEGIVKARPFEQLEDLVKVKGMGAKLLTKLRSYLRL